MKNLIKSLVVCAVAGSAVHLNATTVTVDPTTLTGGYMVWTPVSTDAAGYGGNNGGGQGWGVSALPAVFNGSTLTISPNVNTFDVSNPNDTYWDNADGSGANLMDASIFATVAKIGRA